MPMLRTWLVPLALGCATVGGRAGDVEEIRAAHRQFISAVNAGALDRAFEFVAEEFVAMPECSANQSRAEFRAGLARFAERYTPAYDFDVQEVVVSGDWAFERIRYWGTITPKDGGVPRATSWRAVAIWHRQARDVWKVARYIRTPDAGTGLRC
jgi:ketosteroid isomerase-like protein